MEAEMAPIGIITVSDRASAGEYQDRGGPAVQQWLEAQFAEPPPFELRLVADDLDVIEQEMTRLADNCALVVTTGGTGLTGRDGTPEALGVLFDKEIEGFGEVFRMLSYEEIGASTLQSRCVAGVANGTYIFTLPGSSGACATGWDKLIGPQLDSTNQPCNLVDLMPRLLET